MRDLPIAYGHSSHAKKWSNKTTTFDDLCERLKTTIRTPESVEEYAKMKSKERETAKDHGGFMCGALTGGRRLLQNVACRSMINLDGDRVTADFVDDYENRMKYRSCLYSTHGHVPDAPRVRILIPLTRDVTSEEYVAVSRYVAEELGIDMFDECSYLPNQMMYWPSTPANGEFLYLTTDGDWLDPDDILSAHPEWTDPARLPASSRESEAKGISDKKQADPLEKDGIVGMFNNAYFPVNLAIDAFLSEVYELSADGSRYRYKESSSQPGVEIKEGGKFVYSHHAKDPAYLKLCSAFDIVRIHLFGDEDEKKSFRSMAEFASKDEKVKMLILETKQREAETDFDVSDEDDFWKKKLEYEPRSTLLKNSLHNITLIMENDPNLKGIVFNQLADGSIEMQLYDGEIRRWQMPPKPVKPKKPKPECKRTRHLFDGKIFCGKCGRRYGRAISDTTDGGHLYWYCRAKSTHDITCDSVNYPDSEIKDIFCKVMGKKTFDEDYFTRTVDRMVVQGSGSIDFHLKDGTVRTYETLKLRSNRHETTSTDEFNGKIQCACCGNLYHRYCGYGKYVYWRCSGKHKVRTECNGNDQADFNIRKVSAYMMGMDDFDGTAFTEQIDRITAYEDGSLEYTFRDGRIKKWQKT